MPKERVATDALIIDNLPAVVEAASIVILIFFWASQI
jgi:hypothetical protein